MKARMADRSGQILLIGIMLFVTLVIAVPAVVYLTQSGSVQQMQITKREKAALSSNEALQFARTIFVTANDFDAAIKQAVFPSVCNSGKLTSTGGSFYSVSCSTGSSATEYQVRLLATAYDGLTEDARALHTLVAYVSERTLGPSGVPNASGAGLVLMNPPVVDDNRLYVHWGPIVCVSSTSWTLQDPMDMVGPYRGYPRKFSQGAIQGKNSYSPRRAPDDSSPGRLSDQKEYWAFNSGAVPNPINEQDYITKALQSRISVGRSGIELDANHPAQSGRFKQPSSSSVPLLFDEDFKVGASTTVIVVDGNARWENVNMDLRDGAFIVNGNLELAQTDGSHGFGGAIRIPGSAPAEYGYWTEDGSPTWPCQSQYKNGYKTCDAEQEIDHRFSFRGLLYVKGDITVQTGDWYMSGTVMVGDMMRQQGVLKAKNTGSLHIFYDDEVNRKITTPHFEIQVDSVTVIGARP